MDLVSPTTKKPVEAIYNRRESRSLPVRASLAIETLMNSKPASKSPPQIGGSKEAEAEEQTTMNTTHSQHEQRNDIHRLFTMLDDLQDEVSSIKRTVDGIAKTGLPDGEEHPAGAGFEQELDLVADNVLQISERISEIDTLRLEVKVLKRRIQRLEDGVPSTQSTHTITGLTQDSPQPLGSAGLSGSLPSRLSVVGNGNLNPPPPMTARALEPPLNATNGSSISNDVEMTIGSVVASDATQQGVPINNRSGAPSLTPNPLVSKIQDTQYDTEMKPIESNHATPTDYAPPKLPGFLASRSSSTSSRMSSLATESPPRPKTPPTTRYRRTPRSATSLNNHGVIPGSDPEDGDYDPRSPHKPKTPPPRGSFRTRGSSRARRSAPGIHLSAPEWEREDWTGDKEPMSPILSGHRSRGIMRRSIGGRAAPAPPHLSPHRAQRRRRLSRRAGSAYQSAYRPPVAHTSLRQRRQPPARQRPP